MVDAIPGHRRRRQGGIRAGLDLRRLVAPPRGGSRRGRQPDGRRPQPGQRGRGHIYTDAHAVPARHGPDARRILGPRTARGRLRRRRCLRIPAHRLATEGGRCGRIACQSDSDQVSIDMSSSGKPFIVGLGGTLRANSSTERALRYCLESVERQGGRTRLFSAEDLDLPMYAPHELERTARALELVTALRDADAVVVGSPGYHGAVSGLVKNALDYIEDLREDPRVYLDNTPWGCISCAYGWQAAVGTLGQLRSIGHALRAWPTPLGVAINSADEIWDGAGLLTDTGVQGNLDLLATQLLTFARAAWETA